MKAKLFLSIFFVLSLAINAQTDKLAKLRTEKKIESIVSVSSNYFTVQILALKEAPTNPGYFGEVDFAKEFVCADGYVRYTVGEYSQFSDAEDKLEELKGLGYTQAFITNTQKLSLEGGSGTVNKNGRFTIQLSAFRFPVYLSHFDDVEGIKEYYLKDRVYRYCIGDYSWEDGVVALSDYKSKGYKDAFLVDVDKYKPYQIE